MNKSPRVVSGLMQGEAFVLGDHVDSDAIIPVRHCVRPTPDVLTKYCLTAVDSDFPAKAKHGLILVAGRDFGRGSANENAVRALLLSGVRAVVAISFGLLFRRNAVNMGLPIMICPKLVESTKAREKIEVDFENQRCANVSKGHEYTAEPLSEIELRIIRAGGLVNLVKRGQMEAVGG